MIYELALKEWGRDRNQIRHEWSQEYLNLMVQRMADRKLLESGEKPQKQADTYREPMKNSNVSTNKVAVING